MGFLTSIFKKQANQLPLNDIQPWREAGIVGSSRSGVRVNPRKAMTFTAVLACVRVIAETLASLPLITYEQIGDRKERARDFYMYPLMHDQPNPLMTSFEFREMLQAHLIQWGNALCEIEYSVGGQILALWPLLPWMIREIQLEDGELFYKYELPNGRVTKLPGWRVWHLRGLSGNGIVGYTLTELSEDSVGLGLAAEQFGGLFFGNGARPGGVLEHPGVLGDTAHKHVRESWNETHGGLEKSHRVAILEEGMQYKSIGVPPEAAQFLETRKFQRTEIASILRVPPHMIADLEHATFSNIEHQAISFVVHTMRPWLVRWEQSIKMNLMTSLEQQRYYVEFLVDALLRGDILSRYQAYGMGRQWGWLSVNDVRRLENMNPVENGDIYLQPMNMTEAGWSEPIQPTQAQAMNGHYRLLAEEAAGRLVRKERAAVTRIYERGVDVETNVNEFYRNHADLVAQTMRMSLALAEQYCNDQADAILATGGWLEMDADIVVRLADAALTETADG